MSQSIKVCVRVRPFLPHEPPQACIVSKGNQLTVSGTRSFAFDNVFDTYATSNDIYRTLGEPSVETFIGGHNVSIIAYGQTGSGKTFTMDTLTSEVIQSIFYRLENASRATQQGEGESAYTLRLSVLELYNEALGDLLVTEREAALKEVASPFRTQSPLRGGYSEDRHASASVTLSPVLQLREDSRGSVYVEGLTEVDVSSAEELQAQITSATAYRQTAPTVMNDASSRSHCVVTITLHHKGIVSKMSLVDLAGSERLKKSHGAGVVSPAVASAGQKAGDDGGIPRNRLREGISINGGLLALSNVMVALCERKSYVPYRSSKLTRLLQPMLGGNSKTTIVACVSPAASSMDESLSTVRYADRAKSIQTLPHLVVSGEVLNETAERTILELRQALEQTRLQLHRVTGNGTRRAPAGPRLSPAALSARIDELQRELAIEKSVTKRLEGDLFHAEYKTMVEVEKRKALEQHMADLERSFLTGSRSSGVAVSGPIAINTQHASRRCPPSP